MLCIKSVTMQLPYVTKPCIVSSMYHLEMYSLLQVKSSSLIRLRYMGNHPTSTHEEALEQQECCHLPGPKPVMLSDTA